MSYGVNAAWGLKPVKSLSGYTWSGQANPYVIASGYNTNLFTNDPIGLVGDGTIAICSAGATMAGVFNGCKYQLNNVEVFAPYWPASTSVDANTTVQAFVVDDPNILVDVQTNGAGGMALADLNDNYNFASGAGSTTSGLSGYTLGQSTVGHTATLNLKPIALTPAVNNSFGVGYNNVICILNNHYYKGGTGNLGV